MFISLLRGISLKHILTLNMQIKFAKAFPILFLLAAVLPAFQLTVQHNVLGKAASALADDIKTYHLGGNVSDQMYAALTSDCLLLTSSF